MTDQVTEPQNTPTQIDKPWYDGADADTIGYIQNKKWDKESPLKVLEGYRNLEKFHGVPADKIIKLPASDDPAEWGAIYDRLGRPESPDKYGMDSIQVPEGVELDSETVNKFDALFHQSGITKSQRDKILNEYVKFEGERTAAMQQKIDQETAIQVDALKKEWGSKFDERVDMARRAFKSFLPDGADKDAVAAAFEQSVGPAVAAKMFANLADKLGEDKFHDDSEPADQRFGYSREQAINDKNTLMNELKSDRSRLDAYNRGKGLDYEKMMRLNKIIAGA